MDRFVEICEISGLSAVPRVYQSKTKSTGFKGAVMWMCSREKRNCKTEILVKYIVKTI